MLVIAHPLLKKFLKSLEYRDELRAIHMLTAIEQYPHTYMYPYIKKVSTSIFEICIKGKPQIRILFTYRKNQILLLHGFIKKTQKLPPRELRLAQKRMLECR